MFQIGFWELIVVVVVAVFVFGPERLPALARVLARRFLRAKASFVAFKKECCDEFERTTEPLHDSTTTHDNQASHDKREPIKDG